MSNINYLSKDKINWRDQLVCDNCKKTKIEHAECPNYDSKALTNPCKKFVNAVTDEKENKE